MPNPGETYLHWYEWGASVARCPPNRAYFCVLGSNSEGFNIVVGTYEYGPMTVVPYRTKVYPLRARRSCFAPVAPRPEAVKRMKLVEAPGTAPGSERLLRKTFIVIVGQARRLKYRRWGRFLKGQVSVIPVGPAFHRHVRYLRLALPTSLLIRNGRDLRVRCGVGNAAISRPDAPCSRERARTQ